MKDKLIKQKSTRVYTLKVWLYLQPAAE